MIKQTVNHLKSGKGAELPQLDRYALSSVIFTGMPLLDYNLIIIVQMGHHIVMKSLTVCIIYGIMSILQTLNSRYLYRVVGFDYYSFVFAIQRVAIICVFYFFLHWKIRRDVIVKILPYSLFMCLSNILSSYCLTIMPLAAFLSFKKFIVLFILILAVAFKLPSTTNQFQNICIVGIVVGGALVGQRDLFHGNAIGYLCCMMFNISESITLHYAVHLYRDYKLEPSELLLYNCVISLPYYLGVLTYEAEFDDIFYYFKDHFSFALLFCLLFSIVLASISELSSSYIAMKISPFEKSTVANIKDLILMVISVTYFHDFTINWVSGIGIVLCLVSSTLFSLPFLEQADPQVASIPIAQTSSFSFHPEQGTSLYEQKRKPISYNPTKQEGQTQKPHQNRGQNKAVVIVLEIADQQIAAAASKQSLLEQ